ncbi:6-bladed beta-propeller [bacterium]|nr:6-bladed beta-propeller [bacterium]
MRKIILSTFILFSFFGILQAQKYKIEDVFQIGGPEIEDGNLIFLSPQELHTDSEGNIYIRDIVSRMGCASTEISKFDKYGKFVKKIARSGQGPGEFQRINSFNINDKDELVILGEINNKLSFFSKDGQLLKEVQLDKEHRKHIVSIWPYKGCYLVNQYDRDKPNDPIFYIYDSTFTTIIDTFGTREDFWEFDKNVEFTKSRSMGAKIQLAFTQNDQFIGIPEFYDGDVIYFDRTDGAWNFNRIEGKKPYYKSYKLVKMTDMSSGKKPDLDFFKKPIKVGSKISHSSGWFNFQYIYYNNNVGLYTLNDTSLIQFIIYSTKKKKYELGFNEFSVSGNFLGYQALQIYDKDALFNVKVIGATNGNEFFITDEEDDCPVIRKIRII